MVTVLSTASEDYQRLLARLCSHSTKLVYHVWWTRTHALMICIPKDWRDWHPIAMEHGPFITIYSQDLPIISMRFTCHSQMIYQSYNIIKLIRMYVCIYIYILIHIYIYIHTKVFFFHGCSFASGALMTWFTNAAPSWALARSHSVSWSRQTKEGSGTSVGLHYHINIYNHIYIHIYIYTYRYIYICIIVKHSNT